MPTNQYNVRPRGEDLAARGTQTSAERWMNTAMDSVPVTGFHMGDQGVAPGGNYVRDPSLVTIDPTTGQQVTPRWNVGQAGVNDHFTRNTILSILALAAGGVGLEALGGASAGTTGGYMDAIGNAAEGANAGASLTGPISGSTVASGGGSSAADATLPPSASTEDIVYPGQGQTPAGPTNYGTTPDFTPGPSTGGGYDPAWDVPSPGSDITLPSDHYTVLDNVPQMQGPGAFDQFGTEGPGFLDRLASGLDSLSSLSTLSKLPGIASALGGAGAQPGGKGGGSGGTGLGGGGNTQRNATRVQLEQNPYLQARVALPGSLMSYLRG